MGTGAARGPAQLLQLYRQIDGLEQLGWRAPRSRRWQAETLDCMRRCLGFHPAVVQFQGLRFRAGPVTSAPEDLAGVTDERHDERFHADLREARRLLRTALTGLGLDPDAAPEPPAGPAGTASAHSAPAGAPSSGPPPGGASAAPSAASPPASAQAIVAAARADARLTPEQQAAVERAAERLGAALAARVADWESVAAPLRLLLGYGPAVGGAAVAHVAARLGRPV